MKKVSRLKKCLGICTEGFPFIAISMGLTALSYFFCCPLFVVMLMVTVWVIAFFRDPERHADIVFPKTKSTLLCPADGTVIKIETGKDLFNGEDMQKVSIFMSIFNVHVNRIPVDGRITRMHYREGKFLPASFDKSSEDNERLSLEMDTQQFGRIVFAQIAGLIARRIVSSVNEGDEVTQGQRFGMIRFGSRMDIYFKQGTKVLVNLGDKVKAGQSLLAQIESETT